MRKIRYSGVSQTGGYVRLISVGHRKEGDYYVTHDCTNPGA